MSRVRRPAAGVSAAEPAVPMAPPSFAAVRPVQERPFELVVPPREVENRQPAAPGGTDDDAKWGAVRVVAGEGVYRFKRRVNWLLVSSPALLAAGVLIVLGAAMVGFAVSGIDFGPADPADDPVISERLAAVGDLAMAGFGPAVPSAEGLPWSDSGPRREDEAAAPSLRLASHEISPMGPAEASDELTATPSRVPAAEASAPPMAPTAPPRETREPALLSRVAPAVPEAALAAGASGIVELRVTIDRQGRVTGMTEVSGHPLLRAAAIEAVRQWQYEPGLRDGRPAEFTKWVAVAFDPPAR